jgi:hypothetical protein
MSLVSSPIIAPIATPESSLEDSSLTHPPLITISQYTQFTLIFVIPSSPSICSILLRPRPFKLTQLTTETSLPPVSSTLLVPIFQIHLPHKLLTLTFIKSGIYQSFTPPVSSQPKCLRKLHGQLALLICAFCLS